MKEKLKVYHGLPKTPITDDVLFRASFDGSVQLTPCSSIVHQGDYIFEPNVTGYGIRYPSLSDSNVGLSLGSLNIPVNEFTLDLWFIPKVAVTSAYQGRYIGIGFNNISDDANYYVRFERDIEQTKYHLWSNGNLAIGNFDFSSNNLENPHHLRICFRVGGYCKLFINGIEVSDIYSNVLNPRITHIDRIDIGGKNASISEVVITNGYNDKFFPTLPQDFIDGKAIVVPALNQRQSYGDPVLHQVTELVVKNQPFDVLGTIYDLNDKDSDNLERCFTNPELRTGYADSWEQGQAKIRITGLEKSIITGVFDTDTAKCRIVSEVRNTRIVPVNSVSGISVGDTLVYVYSSDFRVFNLTYTVQAVDSVNNTITLDSNSNWYAGDYFFETTASSSSPVVKTVDGTVVNGTWSGLGTNVATFTLGSNSNIAGKDLVVTYCLNAVGNSSPYPKMPSEVIRGYNELGDTMFPTDNIVLTDNFTGKITGDLSSCPHSLKYFCASSTLKSPKDTDWVEFAQHQYNALSNNQEVSIATDTNNMIPQILVEWDLVELIERKFGGTIPGNKINWINGNVSKVQCYAICRGENGETYKSTLSYYNSSSSWSTNSSGATITSPEFKQLKCLVSNESGNIYKTTNFYCLIYSDVVKNSNTAQIILKDIYFEIIFKTDTRFDYLFPENPLSKCNPILIDKQTKEVKRLLPSTAPFSTEVLVHNPTTMSTPITTLIKGTDNVMTTLGSGSSCNKYDVMRGLIGKLGMESHLYTNDTLNKLTYYSVSDHDQRTKIVPRQYYFHNYAKNEIADEDVPKNMSLLAVAYDLVVTDSKEVAMETLCHVIENGKRTEYITHTYVLPNRPLIK